MLKHNSISSYGSSTVPSWITINSLTGVLTITAPNVSADTEFYFYATSSITGVSNPVQKLIKLTVVNCQVQNWDKCSMSSSTTWVTWSSGSTLNSDSSTIASTIRIYKIWNKKRDSKLSKIYETFFICLQYSLNNYNFYLLNASYDCSRTYTFRFIFINFFLFIQILWFRINSIL